MIKNIMIVGVGGQGTILASKIIGTLLINKGYDVKVSEIHGMSQRGGSVVTYVRYGDKVYSPLIDKGEADYILSFELLEAARYSEYLKEGGKIITNTQEIMPMPVVNGEKEYPKDIVNKIKNKGIDIEAIDAEKIAVEIGNIKVVNSVLLGRFSKYLDFSVDEWKDAMKKEIAEKLIDLNIKAFDLGRD